MNLTELQTIGDLIFKTIGIIMMTGMVVFFVMLAFAPWVERYHERLPNWIPNFFFEVGIIGFGEEAVFNDIKPYLDSLRQPDEDDLDYAPADSPNPEILHRDE